MKKALITTTKSALLAIVILFIHKQCTIQSKHAKELKNCKLVKLGMSLDSVNHIMGYPNKIYHRGSLLLFTYTNNKLFFMPPVQIQINNQYKVHSINCEVDD